MRVLLITASLLSLAHTARIKRQDLLSGRNPLGEVLCPACISRAQESPNMACCRCQDETAFCNNDLAAPRQETSLLPIEEFPVRDGLRPGLTCRKDVECRIFGSCTEDDSGCLVDGNDISVRQGSREQCPRGQTLCCNPVPGDVLVTRLGLLNGADPLGESNPDPSPRDLPLCMLPQLRAVINFNFGVSCGKRDSRVYSQTRKSAADGVGGVGEVTNPGEWPWAVLIYTGQTYVGAGVLMDNDVVVTTATKVVDYRNNPGALTVRLGDFDPNLRAPNNIEDFPHVEVDVTCVKLHPRFKQRELPYNVAVLKLDFNSRPPTEPTTVEEKSVFSVVDLRSSAPRRPANRPDGVDGSGWNHIKNGGSDNVDSIGLRIGLLSDLNSEVDPLGEPVSGNAIDDFIPRSYINTACLPRANNQFAPGTRCWVAAWGEGLIEQREVDIPLVSKSECERALRPEFRSRGVRETWNLSPSEICAGGEPGKDSCDGEGGAPLVCLNEGDDQFYAVGLVNYGFDCKKAIPAVYTNLADPDIKRFIESSFDTNFC